MAELMLDVVAVLVLAFIAYHGLTYRDKNGDRPFVHLLFGCIALLFAMRFLFSEIFHIW